MFIAWLSQKTEAFNLDSQSIFQFPSHHHNFLSLRQNLSWEDLASKKIEAPFVPQIDNELDVRNFATEFTAMIPQDSPAIVPPNMEKAFMVRMTSTHNSRKFERCLD